MWRYICLRLAAVCIVFAAMAAPYAHADPRYTPPHFWTSEWRAEFYEEWFGGQLHAMGEPSLWQLSKDDKSTQVYRLLQLPSFSGAVAARLVVQADGSGKMYVTELDGSGGYKKPGKPGEKRLIDLNSQQVRALDALFKQTDFWDERIGVSERTDRPRTYVCTDGIRYVVEAVSGGTYKLVTRHMCWMEDEYFEILSALTELSGTEPPFRFER